MLKLSFSGTDFHEDADLSLSGSRFAEDSGLRTAVIVSLFTDGLADAFDEIPDTSTNRRGYWGDVFPDVEGDEIGSKVWLLQRSILTDENVRRLQSSAKACLQWAVEDGVADRVVAVASRQHLTMAALEVAVYKGANPVFQDRWAVEFAGGS